MGNTLSQVRLALREFLSTVENFNTLKKRIRQSPGFPVPNPTLSFWTVPPSPIARYRSSPDLPSHADIVIIGSGITGTSIVRELLESGRDLDVVMLEARDTCSGATGRNGGHVSPVLYHEYPELKTKYGAAQAQAVIRFRLAHITELGAVALAEDPGNYCQFRLTESFDVYYDAETWANAKQCLNLYMQDLPDESGRFAVYEGEQAIEKYRLAKHTVGCIVNHKAGAIHPYRLVTATLARLLRSYPQFKLYTQMPCTAIIPPSSTTPFYTVLTDSGVITTPHVVHATNSHTSTLLEPMRTKIIPLRGTMSAQRPGQSFSSLSTRSYVLYYGGDRFDYLTQLPSGENELMLGAGAESVFDAGVTDDASYDPELAIRLSGALSVYFGESNWGAEKTAIKEEPWFDGRVKAIWSGIMGFSADGQPWVGRLPRKISGRAVPPSESRPNEKAQALTAAPGEWISAGYSGEGMVHAWLCGKALAHMMLDRKVDGWFPEVMRINEKRWRKARLENII